MDDDSVYSNISNYSVNERLIDRSRTSWISSEVVNLLQDTEFPKLANEGYELIRRRRVLDFLVIPGSFSARVYGDDSKPRKVEVKLAQLPDETWENVFEFFSTKSLFFAKLLAGKLTPAVGEAFGKANVSLPPESLDDFQFFLEGTEVKELDPQLSAVIYRFAERLIEDPFLLFTLRGRGREETLLEIRRRRASQPREIKEMPIQPTEDPAELIRAEIDPFGNFYKAGKGYDHFSYSIKADELPAAILRWIEPIPLAGLEADVEPLLELGYEMVARRAQAYGLDLTINKRTVGKEKD